MIHSNHPIPAAFHAGHVAMNPFGMAHNIGPTSPPIFVGHVRSSKTKNSSIQALISGKTDIFVDEIPFAGAVFIEGIHIVPFKVCPPGFNIEGLTTPDINSRSFLINLYNKIPLTTTASEAGATELISLTVRGGVQWHAIPSPRNQMPVRTLLLGGDFEVITIIIHGQVISGSSDLQVNALNQQVSLSNSIISASSEVVAVDTNNNSKIQLPSNDNVDAAVIVKATPIKDEDSVINELWEVSNDQPLRSAMASLLLPDKEASATRNSSEYRKLKAITARFPQLVGLQPKLSKAAAGVLGRSCKRHRVSVVALGNAANLVEEIFRYEERECIDAEAYACKAVTLGRIAELLDACWESSKTHRCLVGASKDSVDSCIGAEAASILGAIVTAAMDPLRCDAACPSLTIAACGGGPDLQRQYATAVFNCVRGILMNDFVAAEFSECGGMALLCYLLQQQACITDPSLRLLPMILLLECFRCAVSLSSSCKIVLDAGHDYSDLSTYQSFIHLLKDLPTTSIEEAAQLKMVLNWLALADSLQALHAFSFSVLNATTEIADALSWYSSKVQSNNASTSSSNAGEEGAEGSIEPLNGESDKLMSVLRSEEELCPVLLMRCAAVIAGLKAVTDAMRCSDGIGCELQSDEDDLLDLHASLVTMLMQSHLMSSLVAVVSLVMMLDELVSSLEWMRSSSVPLIAQHIKSIAHMCYTMFSQLMELPMGGLFFAVHAEPVLVLWELVMGGSSNQHCSLEVPFTSQRCCLPRPRIHAIEGVCHLSYHESMGLLHYLLWSINYSNLTLCLLDDISANLHQCIRTASTCDRSTYQTTIDLLKQLLDQCTNTVCMDATRRVVIDLFLDDVMDAVAAALEGHGDGGDELHVQVLDLVMRLVQGCLLDDQLMGAVHRSHAKLLDRVVKVVAVFNSKKDELVVAEDVKLKWNILAEYYSQPLYHHQQNALATTTSNPTAHRRLIDTMKCFDVMGLCDPAMMRSTSQQLIAAALDLLHSHDPRPRGGMQSEYSSLLEETTRFINRLSSVLCILYGHHGATLMMMHSMDVDMTVRDRDVVALNIQPDRRLCETKDDGGGHDPSHDATIETTALHRTIHRSLVHLIAVSSEILWTILSSIADTQQVSSTTTETILSAHMASVVSTAVVVHSLSGMLQLFVPCSIIAGEGSDDVSQCLEASLRTCDASMSILHLLVQQPTILAVDPPLTCIIRHGLQNPPCLALVLSLLTRLLPAIFHSWEAYGITTDHGYADDAAKHLPTPLINGEMPGERHDEGDRPSAFSMSDDVEEVQLVLKRVAASESRHHQQWKNIVSDSIRLGDSSMAGLKLPDHKQMGSLFRAEVSLDAIMASLDVDRPPIDCDPLHRAVYLRVYDLTTILLASLWSTSQSIHSECVSLMDRCMSIDHDASHLICSSVVTSITYRIARYHRHHQTTPTPTSAASTDEDTGPYDEDQDRKAICRVIVSVIHLCDNSILHSFLFVRSGVLVPLFLAMRFKVVSISLLALQCITAIYKSMLKMLTIETMQSKTEGVVVIPQKSSSSSFIDDLSAVLDAMSMGVSELLVLALRSFQRIHNLGLVALQQGALTLSLMPSNYQLRFVHSLGRIGEGVSLEFMAIKIWNAFDESYESLIDLTNQLKALKKEAHHGINGSNGHHSSKDKDARAKEKERKAAASKSASNAPQHSEPELLALINKSYRKLHSSTVSLHAIVHIVLHAYTEGWIGLSAVHKAFRTSQHGDPKRAMVRCQKGYVMWLNAINSLVDSDAATADSVLKSRSSAIYRSTIDALTGLSIDQLRRIEGLPTERRLFDARHASINEGLKMLVEEMVLFTRFASAKEERFMGRKDPLPQPLSDRQLDIHRDAVVHPFRSSGSHHRVWFDSFHQGEGLCNSNMKMDLIARDLRQIIEGPVLVENSSPLNDKKVASSIYSGGWLWEGFRVIQRLHMKDEQEQRRRRQSKDEMTSPAMRKRSLSDLMDLPRSAATGTSMHSPIAINTAATSSIGFTQGFLPGHAATTASMMMVPPAFYSGPMGPQLFRAPPSMLGGHSNNTATTTTTTTGAALTGSGGMRIPF